MPYFHQTEKKTDFKFWAAHHYFTGYLITLIGFYLLFHGSAFWAWFIFGLGVWIQLDDWFQHSVQRAQMKLDGYYDVVSFWNWFPYLVLAKIRGLFR